DAPPAAPPAVGVNGLGVAVAVQVVLPRCRQTLRVGNLVAEVLPRTVEERPADGIARLACLVGGDGDVLGVFLALLADVLIARLAIAVGVGPLLVPGRAGGGQVAGGRVGTTRPPRVAHVPILDLHGRGVG